jgi:hypothetical protein
MKQLIMAAAFAAALAVSSGPALANGCPKLIAANKQSIAEAEKAGKDPKKVAEAKRLNDEAAKFHAAGSHAESMEAAGKAKASLI